MRHIHPTESEMQDIIAEAIVRTVNEIRADREDRVISDRLVFHAIEDAMGELGLTDKGAAA